MKVGLALQTFVAYLDRIVSVSNLYLSLKNLGGDDEGGGNNENEIKNKDAAIPSFEESIGRQHDLGRRNEVLSKILLQREEE